jgi:hypothetical protein
MGRECSTYGEKANAYSVLVGRPEGNRPLETQTHRGKDNIKISLGV